MARLIFMKNFVFAFRPHHCEHNPYYDVGAEAEPQGGTRPGRLRSGRVPQWERWHRVGQQGERKCRSTPGKMMRKLRIPKVTFFLSQIFSEKKNSYVISVMGEEVDAILRSSLVGFRLLEHSKNLWESTVPPICYFHLRSDSHVSVHRWDDRQDAHTGNIEGKVPLLFIKEN